MNRPERWKTRNLLLTVHLAGVLFTNPRLSAVLRADAGPSTRGGQITINVGELWPDEKYSIKGAYRKVRDTSDTSLPLPACLASHTSATMGVSWQTDEQKQFINERVPLYSDHQAKSTTKDFWPEFHDKWFKRWPLPENLSPSLAKMERKRKTDVSTIYPPTS